MTSRLLRRAAAIWTVPLVLLGLWWFISAGSQSPFFPPLQTIAEAFVRNWLFDRLPSDVLPSLWRLLAGYGIALAAAMAIGLALGMWPLARRAFEPVLEYLRALPAIVLLPLFIVVLGVGAATKIAMIAFGAFWPVLLNTIEGVRATEPVLLDAARSSRLGWWQRVRLILLPGTTPYIFAGARTALAISFILMVTSEMMAATDGIGYFVLQSQSTFAVADMWSGIILLGILGYLLNGAFLFVQRRALRWHEGYRSAQGLNSASS